MLTAAIWIALAGVLLRRLAVGRDRLRDEASSPAGLTGVAGTAVLGTRLIELGWGTAGMALLGLAFAAWCALLPIVLGRLRGRADGVAFMVTVATEGIATLAAAVGSAEHSGWLVDAAVALAVAGLALYPLVLSRFDLGQLKLGRGDHWVAGGSLAISALALAEITVAARHTGATGSLESVLRDSALVVWALAVAWIPVLVLAELRWPRLRYDTRRWATVFPLGMYAACSFSVASAAGVPGIADFARGWVWVAAAAWAFAFAAMLRSIARAVRHAIPRPRATPLPPPGGSTMPPGSCRPPAR